jgi:hypothetical protein
MDPGNTVDPQIFVDEMTSRLPDKQYLVAEVGQCIRYSDGVLEALNDS